MLMDERPARRIGSAWRRKFNGIIVFFPNENTNKSHFEHAPCDFFGLPKIVTNQDQRHTRKAKECRHGGRPPGSRRTLQGMRAFAAGPGCLLTSRGSDERCFCHLRAGGMQQHYRNQGKSIWPRAPPKITTSKSASAWSIGTPGGLR